jgi:hypothetical protein
LKKIFTVLLTLISLQAFSQGNFSKLGFGVHGGATIPFTGFTYDNAPNAPTTSTKTFDINKSTGFGASLDYFLTPYASFGLEYNSIQLKDGPDQHNRAFISKFSSIEVNGTLAAGQIIDASYHSIINEFKNLNISLGAGIISGTNNVNDYDPNLDQTNNGGTNNQLPFSRQHGGDIGKSEFKNILAIPVGIGYYRNIYNTYDEAMVQIGLKYKTVFTLTDDLDGFNDDPTRFKNNSNDVYSTLSLSIKFIFGPKGIYYR